MIHSVLLLTAQHLQSNLGRLSEPKLIEVANATHERMARALSHQGKNSPVESLKPYRLLKSSGEDMYMIDSALGDSVDIFPNGVVNSFFHYVSLDPTKPFLPEAKLRSSALRFFTAFEPSLAGLDGEFDPGMFWNVKDGGWYRFFRPVYRNVPVGPGGIGRITLEGNTGICMYVTARKMLDINNVRPSKLTADEAASIAISKTLRSGKSSVVSLNRPAKKWLTGNGTQFVYAFDSGNPVVKRMARLDTGEFTYEVFVQHEDAVVADGESRPLSGYLISTTDGSVVAELQGGPGAKVEARETRLPERIENVSLEVDGKRAKVKVLTLAESDQAPVRIAWRDAYILTSSKSYRIKLSDPPVHAMFYGKIYRVTKQ